MSLCPSRLSAIVSNGLRPVRLIRSEEGRQVWHARDHRGRRLTLIRARSFRAVKKVRQEIALLRALSARNIPAVPALKWRGVAAYAIAEGPSALAPPRGKRAERGPIAGAGAGEAQAASDLTALLSTLHSQNLALGLQGVRGLELAPNGRVVVTDFSRVTNLTPVSKRHDEQWRARLTSGLLCHRVPRPRVRIALQGSRRALDTKTGIRGEAAGTFDGCPSGSERSPLLHAPYL